MTILADATALILLAKAGLLETFADRNNVLVPDFVYHEVIRGKEKGREDSLLVEKLIKEGKLRTEEPDKSVKKHIENLFSLKAGELDVISLAHRTKHTILSDDKKCINTAKVLGLDFITSLDVVVTLHKKGLIDRERALNCVESLDEYGWHKKDIIKSYKEALK